MFPDQGSNPVSLHWEQGVLDTDHQRSPSSRGFIALGFIFRCIIQFELNFDMVYPINKQFSNPSLSLLCLPPLEFEPEDTASCPPPSSVQI